MIMKKFKKSLTFLLLVFTMFPNIAFAYSDYLIPGGENVGIEVRSKGVLVVGLYEVNNTSPASKAGIKIGDTIIKVNKDTVSNIEELTEKIKNKTNVQLTYLRDQKQYETKLELITVEGVSKTGLYVKDTITGVGTLSFIDPNTKLYGALGHEITESNTGMMLEVKSGNIYKSSVLNIERSENGNPGSKIADLKLENEQGNIKENTIKGIFGEYTSELPNKKQYKVAEKENVKIGKATILTVLDGSEVKEYNINILKINYSDTKNILFEITDDNLLEKTGGIIQGMSGSPIIQGDYIIGAVTHVVVDNPKRGYGIFITNMLEEAEN